MKAGMILRSRRRFYGTTRRWLIKKEGELKRQTTLGLTVVKGYRIAPLENLDNCFWVTEEQLRHRFEEAV